jgi:sulfate adenylyltransferase subunit 1 (EFTu-like GTPase family)
MPWFRGVPLLEYLETVRVGGGANQAPFRFPVQRVVRPNRDFRGYAGTVASGRIRVGEAVSVLPSGRQTTIEEIVTFEGRLDEAHAGQAVTLTLRDEIDVARGDLVAAIDKAPAIGSSVEATLVWLNENPAELGKRYRLKHMARNEWAEIGEIRYRLDINTLEREPAGSIEMNSISVVRIDASRALTFDPYADNRTTGSFVLIDAVTNATLAAGLIKGAVENVANSPASERTPGWRLRQGALVLSSDGSGEPITDDEALKALDLLLKKLRIDQWF